MFQRSKEKDNYIHKLDFWHVQVVELRSSLKGLQLFESLFLSASTCLHPLAAGQSVAWFPVCLRSSLPGQSISYISCQADLVAYSEEDDATCT